MGEIRGFVYDKETGEPTIFTTVQLKGTDKGAVTDVNGFYSITKISPGKYTLSVSYLGYDSASIPVKIEANKKLNQNIYLQKSGIELTEINVSGERLRQTTRVEISKVKITPREIEMIPNIGGQADVAQYLQIVPGVVFSGDQGGQLYIRGGAPIQNKVLLDGMTIYNPFHSIGLFSVFDVDIIRSMDVYTGGFNAEYGGRISAIMDITTRDGSKDNLSGKFGISPFTSKLSLEGPLKKFKEGEGSSSFLFSGRTSYLKQTAPVFYGYADENGLPYNFTDLYGKLTFTAPGGSKVNFFGFNFSDNVSFENSTNYEWNSYGVGTKFLLIPPSSSTVVEGNFAFSDYQVKQIEPDNKPRFSQINGFEAGVDFSYYPGKDLVKYGFDVIGFKTDFQFTNAVNRLIQQQDFTTELAGYVRYNKVIGRLILDPSFRVHYYASLEEMSLEPRFGLKYVITDFLRFKAAGGMYSQNLMSAQSDQDVVNLFYGFLSGPEDIPDQFNGIEVGTHLQKARHIVGGLELDLSRNWSFEAEAYLKDFNQLTNINRNKIFDDTQEFRDKPDYLREDFAIETGKAYGTDYKLSYDKKPYYLWLVYSLSYVTRFDGFREYYPHWDRRHNINIMGSYEFGKNKSWQATLRWNFGSGFPFTKTQGFYPFLDFQQGVGTDYTTTNGNMGIFYADLNTGRLSAFHRLDASLQKTYKFKKDRELKVVFSVTNVYNRNNIFYFDRVRYTRVNQLPVLPSIGINYTF